MDVIRPLQHFHIWTGEWMEERGGEGVVRDVSNLRAFEGEGRYRRFGLAAPRNGATCEFPHLAFGYRVCKTASKRSCASHIIFRTRSADRSLDRYIGTRRRTPRVVDCRSLRGGTVMGGEGIAACAGTPRGGPSWRK